jgi:quinol-cytochrome oxidoreductase complex cytochrome b subunit
MEPASHDVGERRGFVTWIEKRLPLRELIESQLTGYYAPKNFNIWYYFGVLALVVLVSQFATGIVLAMFYVVLGRAGHRESLRHHTRDRSESGRLDSR